MYLDGADFRVAVGLLAFLAAATRGVRGDCSSDKLANCSALRSNCLYSNTTQCLVAAARHSLGRYLLPLD